MWIRMLKSGHSIFLLPEQFTAFRIRNDAKNMSAPRPDSVLRCNLELIQIYKQFSSMEPQLIREVFAKEIAQAGINASISPELLLVEMALSANSSAHNLFALQLLFETADNVDDFHRLRELAGKLDIFGISPQMVVATPPVRSKWRIFG